MRAFQCSNVRVAHLALLLVEFIANCVFLSLLDFACDLQIPARMSALSECVGTLQGDEARDFLEIAIEQRELLDRQCKIDVSKATFTFLIAPFCLFIIYYLLFILIEMLFNVVLLCLCVTVARRTSGATWTRTDLSNVPASAIDQHTIGEHVVLLLFLPRTCRAQQAQQSHRRSTAFQGAFVCARRNNTIMV
jgi:hypothetical protein